MPKIKNATYTNRHGVDLTQKEIDRLNRAVDKYNKKTSKRYTSLLKKGFSPNVAQMIAGSPFELNLDFIRRHQYVDRLVTSLNYRTTKRYEVAEKEKLIRSMSTILQQRVGIGRRTAAAFEYQLKRLTLKEWEQWLNDNWQFFNDLFEHYKKGTMSATIYNVEETEHVYRQVTRGLKNMPDIKNIFR